MSPPEPRVLNLPIMGMFACIQDQREIFEYLPTISSTAGVSKYALFIIGLFVSWTGLMVKRHSKI